MLRKMVQKIALREEVGNIVTKWPISKMSVCMLTDAVVVVI